MIIESKLLKQIFYKTNKNNFTLEEIGELIKQCENKQKQDNKAVIKKDEILERLDKLENSVINVIYQRT